MIERIKIQNFKSLVDVDVELRSLNVLIGRNASGKSNFLAFLRLMKEGADEQLNTAVSIMGGIGSVIRYGSSTLSWQLELSEVNFPPDPKPTYEGKIVKNGFYNYIIFSESLSTTQQDHINHIYLSRELRDLKLESLDGTTLENYTELKDQELSIAQIRDRYRYPLVNEFRNGLLDWHIYHGFGEEALRNIRSPQLFNVIDPLRLNPFGSNLISILQHIVNDPRYEAVYERLNDVMQIVFPDFKRFDMPPIAGGMGSLAYRSREYTDSIPALNMSDGMLRFLGLMLLLLLTDGPNPPSLIAIDEPEIGMHPKMLEIFAEILKDASQKTQIIITTHSPQLIDQMMPEDVIVTEKEEGWTTLRHLEPDALKGWLERYALGELWTMGKLRA